MMDIPQLQTWIDDIDTELMRHFSNKDMSCNPLDRAMEYTLLAGGKRLRPLLTMIVAKTLGGKAEEAVHVAMCSEFLHTYSLIHDDLPSMDNDDMRRGKPTNHVIFGEANAILAGDALHSEAFLQLATASYPDWRPERRLQAIAEFGEAVGRRGMVAGQVMDLESQGRNLDLDTLKALHNRKTGALLRFCVRLGGHLVNADEAIMEKLTTYANAIGLLFQVVDDLLDEEGDSATLGKTAGKDAQANKATFPKVLGAEKAHEYADTLLASAEEALEDIDADTSYLCEIARYIRKRTN